MSKTRRRGFWSLCALSASTASGFGFLAGLTIGFVSGFWWGLLLAALLPLGVYWVFRTRAKSFVPVPWWVERIIRPARERLFDTARLMEGIPESEPVKQLDGDLVSLYEDLLDAARRLEIASRNDSRIFVLYNTGRASEVPVLVDFLNKARVFEEVLSEVKRVSSDWSLPEKNPHEHIDDILKDSRSMRHSRKVASQKLDGE